MQDTVLVVVRLQVRIIIILLEESQAGGNQRMHAVRLAATEYTGGHDCDRLWESE